MLRFLIQSQDNLVGVTTLSIGLQIVLSLIILMWYIIMPCIVLFIAKDGIEGVKEFYTCYTTNKINITVIIILFIILCISSIHHNIFTLC